MKKDLGHSLINMHIFSVISNHDRLKHRSTATPCKIHK